MFNYVENFQAAIAALKQEQAIASSAIWNARRGQFPQALWNGPTASGNHRMCSNDISAWATSEGDPTMCVAARTMARAAVEHVHSGTNRSLVELEAELADCTARRLRSFSRRATYPTYGNCDRSQGLLPAA